MKVLSFGEVLWDVYPDQKFLGGAPLNFAAHLAKHSEEAYMLSAVGEDALGTEAILQMECWGVYTDYVARCSEKQTGTCLVTLDEQSIPSYDLLQDVAYDYICGKGIPDDFDVLYFGTLALRSEANFSALKDILRSNRFKEVFVDINIRPPFCCEETVKFAVEHATMLKISEEELPVVYEAFGIPAETTYQKFTQILAQHCDSLHCIVVTLGADGAYVRSCNDGKAYHRGSAVVEVKSTVGAGDSFCAAFLSKYMGGCPIENCLEHAVKVAGLVVSFFDAVPDYTPDTILKM